MTERTAERRQAAGSGARFVAFLITWYQRYLSPHKGFSCPHRLVHQGPSCSEYARQQVLADGIFVAYRKTRERLRECRAAARELAIRSEESGTESDGDESGDSGPVADGKRARRSLGQSAENTANDVGSACDLGGLTCDIADCGLDNCHLPHCEMPHCDTPHCDAPDCGGCGSHVLLLLTFGLSLHSS